MKPLFYSIILVCSFLANRAVSQTVFAPAGAEWYHHHNDGYFHSYVEGDTVILGTTCRKIKQVTIVSPVSWAPDYPKLYTYTSGDTVFVYNTYAGAFTPLYLFNVSDGDTVSLPDFHSTAITRFRIDSVRMVLYDTSILKTVYIQNIEAAMFGGSGPNLSTYGAIFQQYGAYAERIGNVTGGIYPNCRNCPIIPEDCGCIGIPRCYNDADYGLKLVSGPCEPSVGVAETTMPENILLYPDPATDIVTIKVPHAAAMTITSIDGRLIYKATLEANKAQAIDVGALHAGTYFVRVVTPGETVLYRSLRVVR